ncbi:MAG: cellulase [Rhizobiales bacterium 62-17]|nr:cellulase [Hyphomicrobiales bacterium]OJX99762.1 MAG: cellulase [Rhizobiales bacterium 62-17]
MMRILKAIATASLLLASSTIPSWAQAQGVTPANVPVSEPRRVLSLDARAMPLGGTFKTLQYWQAYKARFITNTGRVVDTANDLISHSEGQGYAMLLAVAANDRPTFDRIWTWTRANLMVRDDQLMAWRWSPNHRPGVSDMNNASDGDILVAWALAEAGELWADVSYYIAGRRIAVEVGRKLVLFKAQQGALLLPAVNGFSAGERPDGPVVNLSYYVFPAFARLYLVAPELDWNGLTQTGLDLMKAARFGPQSLPTEWISIRDNGIKPADGFPAQFSYNSIRIPLYMAWAGVGDWDSYAPFYAWSTRKRGSVAAIEVSSGREVEQLGEAGYSSIAALLSCAIDQAPIPANLRATRDADNYYPTTLHMMALLAVQMRYAACLRN